jgi:perosamine synthetase
MSTDRIPWFEPLIDDADVAAVQKAVATGFVNEGPEVRGFEQDLCSYFGVPHAVATPSGTMAIALSLMALGIKHGDTVLVPDTTFIGTGSAVRLTGAEVILVDVDKDSFTMDPADAARKIKPSTKAIVPVHLNGRATNMPALRELAKKHGLVIVEDAAEAIGSKSREGFLGTLSEAGCFSLAPTKIVTSGQGGFVLTHKQEVRDNLIRLRDHGRLSRSSDVHPVTGFNFKVTDMQGALARSQWRKLTARIDRARKLDWMYIEGLKDVSGIRFTPRPEFGGYLMWPDFVAEKREALVEHLAKNQITPRPFWPALHEQPAYASKDPFPGSTFASHHACWLPCAPAMTDSQVERVIDVVRSFFGSRR